ncbi:MAG: hypothetical protein N3G19_01565 [Candidatus Pacearchaeota archaeon]|nr:hypothetical protein [Candidatus Pacearchaeota archaeon]
MIKRGIKIKKAQVTLFIIIAIVVVAVAALILVLWPRISGLFMTQQQAQNYLAIQSIELRKSIADCIRVSSEFAFYRMGLNGGYYDTTGLDFLYFAGNGYAVVMYKDAAKHRINKLPSLTQIENEYQLFLKEEGNEAIDSCINLDAFRRNMNIEAGERKINAVIHADSIVLNVDWPMKLSKPTLQGTAEVKINQREVMLLMPLGNLWQTANKIVDCETRIDCKYEGIEWDKDTWNNPFRLQYITKDARSLNQNQIIFILESLPYRPGELAFKFNFAIDRS